MHDSLLYNNIGKPNKTIYRICYHISNTTGATCGAGSAYPSGAHEITPSFWWGSCCLFFSFLCYVMGTIVCLFVFFIFRHGVVSVFWFFSEFECPSGIFRPSFNALCIFFSVKTITYNLTNIQYLCTKWNLNLDFCSIFL